MVIFARWYGLAASRKRPQRAISRNLPYRNRFVHSRRISAARCLNVAGGTSRRRHPGCQIETVAASHDQLYRDALSGKADIVLNDRRRALSPEWENVHLRTCWRYAEASEASPLAENNTVTCNDLKALPCILVCERTR